MKYFIIMSIVNTLALYGIFYFGRWWERREWNKLIDEGILPRPKKKL